MHLSSDRAELASAITDLLLMLAAVYGWVRVSRRDWRTVFVLLAGTALLGALVHGGEWSPSVHALLWWPLDFLLAAMLACFAATAVRDRWGVPQARRALPLLLCAAVLVGFTSRLFSETLLPFLSFELLVLFGSGLSWAWLARTGNGAGSGRLAWGCMIAVCAGVVQASGAQLQVGGWLLDKNSLFHLIQLVAVGFWISGAKITAHSARAQA